MGKDLKGKELGRGVTQRKDGRYMARIYVKGSKKVIALYDLNLKKLMEKVNNYRAFSGNTSWDIGMTVSQWFEQWMEIYIEPVLKATTIRNYQDAFERVRPLIGYYRLIEVKSSNILSALYKLKEDGYAQTTVKQSFTVLKAMFSTAYYVKAILYNPCEGMRVPIEQEHVSTIGEKRKWADEEDFQKFFEVSRNTRYYELFFVLYNTGLRIGEVCALEWHDVDMEKKCIYINKTINRVEKYYDSKSREMEEPKMVTDITSPKKKASYRTVPITEDIVHAFYTWKEKQNIDKKHLGREWGEKNNLLKEYPDPVFTTSTGMPYLPEEARQECCRLSNCANRLEKQRALLEGREAKLIHIHPHLFRHFFITKCVENNMNPAVIRKITGHASIKMTQHYTHVSNEYILDKYNLKK